MYQSQVMNSEYRHFFNFYKHYLLDAEGVYSPYNEVTKDPETKYGISKPLFKAFLRRLGGSITLENTSKTKKLNLLQQWAKDTGNLDGVDVWASELNFFTRKLQDLTKDEAEIIYWIMFWKPVLSFIDSTAICIICVMVDHNINTGAIKYGKKMLQGVLNLFDDSKLNLDGVVGKKTKNALGLALTTGLVTDRGRKFPNKMETVKKNSYLIALMYNTSRLGYYAKTSGAKHYLTGWVNRIIKLNKYLVEGYSETT